MILTLELKIVSYHMYFIDCFAPCKGIRIPESEKIWIQLKESGIPLRIGIQNPSCTSKDWNQVPGILNPRCGIQQSRAQDCLWLP